MKGDGGAHDSDEHIAEITQVAVDGHHDIGDFVGVVGRRAKLLIDVLEVVDGALLVAEHLHHLLSCHHLLNESVDTSQRLLLGAEEAARPFAQPRGDQHHHEGHEQADERQRYAEHNHRGEGHNDGDDRVEYLCHTR